MEASRSYLIILIFFPATFFPYFTQDSKENLPSVPILLCSKVIFYVILFSFYYCINVKLETFRNKCKEEKVIKRMSWISFRLLYCEKQNCFWLRNAFLFLFIYSVIAFLSPVHTLLPNLHRHHIFFYVLWLLWPYIYKTGAKCSSLSRFFSRSESSGWLITRVCLFLCKSELYRFFFPQYILTRPAYWMIHDTV